MMERRGIKASPESAENEWVLLSEMPILRAELTGRLFKELVTSVESSRIMALDGEATDRPCGDVEPLADVRRHH